MALRNKDSAMNKMSRCRTRNMAPVHSRRGRECDCEFRTNRTLMRSWAEFCDLPIRRDEGRVVNTPLVFKRVLFEEEKEKERTEGGDGKREEKESGDREEPPLDGEKGLVRDWSGKAMNARGDENGIKTDCTGLAYGLNYITSLTNCLANKQCFYSYIRQ
ncbi:hypothetical protein TNCV_505171 [Trichonephila clavipes]|nr:hypothetical protein TNCV_505171 [Trichonephila clavipes]